LQRGKHVHRKILIKRAASFQKLRIAFITAAPLASLFPLCLDLSRFSLRICCLILDIADSLTMHVNARMIIQAARRMEQRALRASQEAKEAEDTARKADRKADKAAQKAYKVAKAAKKEMLVAPQEDDSESEEDRNWDLMDIADLPKEAKEARGIARKARTKADKASQKGYKVRKAANKQMVGALQCLQSKPEDWEEYDLHDWDCHWRSDNDFLGLRKKRMRLTD
jgi:hypothetical protein